METACPVHTWQDMRLKISYILFGLQGVYPLYKWGSSTCCMSTYSFTACIASPCHDTGAWNFENESRWGSTYAKCTHCLNFVTHEDEGDAYDCTCFIIINLLLADAGYAES
jgi:hypothetical protein